MKIRVFEIICFISLFVCVIVSTLSFDSECEDIRQSILRLHVIANSNSGEDQRLKLAVRDRILEEYSEELRSFSSVADAERFVFSETENIERLARSVLAEEGCGFEVHAVLENELFPQRRYANVILPAGEYRALRVVIGSGEGENWWCVMFPPLCCFAESDNGEVLGEEWSIATEDSVEIRFKLRILEIIRGVRSLRD
jgi:stage II sporulation protein R